MSKSGKATYNPNENRYDGRMPYRRCGNSGRLLPALFLGHWHNFGSITPFGVQQSLLRTAFDNGIMWAPHKPDSSTIVFSAIFCLPSAAGGAMAF